MNAISICNMCHHPGVLVCSLGVRAFGGDVAKGLAMLTLIACDHVNRLLNQVEVIVVCRSGRREVEISVNELLGAGVKQSVDVTLVPSRLFDGLKFGVQVVQPLADVSLVRLYR